MSNLQLLPQFDGFNTSFALTANSWWLDIIYFAQPGFGSPVQVSGCNVTSGQNIIAVPSTSMLFPGMTISSLAAGIPSGAYIGVVSTSSVTMLTLGGAPLNSTVSNPDMTLTFNPPPLDLTGISFISHIRRWRGHWRRSVNTQIFLTASTGDGSLICGNALGTLQFNVPHTRIMPIPPGRYHTDIIAFDGIYTLNLFQNTPATVMVGAGISDPSLFVT